jgi:hypothetical protein
MEVKRMNASDIPGTFYGIHSESILDRIEEGSKQPAHKQMDTKPAIDDVVCHYLDGEMLKDALFIIDNIRDHKMKIKWSSINVWSVWYKRKHVCDLMIANSSLCIGPVSGVLVTRVPNVSQNPEKMRLIISALRNPLVSEQELSFAMS